MTPKSWSASNLTVTSWSPDGTLLAGYGPNGATPTPYNVNITFSATGGTFVGQLSYNSETWNETAATFSPNGQQVAFYRSGTNPSGIYVENADGTSPQFLLSDPPSGTTSGTIKQLVWSPFPASETFVGTGGTLSTTPVSGFMMTEDGSQFASLLTFAATTPSKATVTPILGTVVGGPLLYTLAADAITNISYTNAYFGGVTSLSLTATPTAVVTIDATTGQVDLVVAALSLKPAVDRTVGAIVTYTGKIAGIYDGTGKNLAPSGATTVRINRLTGKLDSFQ